jgi:thymidylate kinase
MGKENNHEAITPNGTLIMIRGIPGSGKSTLSRRMLEMLGSRATEINPDEARYKNGHFDNNSENEAGIFAYLDSLAKDRLRDGGVVVWQQVWTTLKTGRNLQDHIRDKFNPGSLILIEIDIPKEVAWERIVNRESQGGSQRITRDEFDRYVNQYISLGAVIAESERILINGQDLLEKNVDIVERRLKSMNLI